MLKNNYQSRLHGRSSSVHTMRLKKKQKTINLKRWGYQLNSDFLTGKSNVTPKENGN